MQNYNKKSWEIGISARNIAKKRVDAAIAYRRMEGQENMSKSLTLG